MPTVFVWQGLRIRRALLLGLIMIAALAAFELFNFSTTEYALATFFGGHYDALGIASWATVLAIAFCGIDFAGLARLFTPETQWHKEAKEIRLVTGAWFLGAAFNAALTWWAIVSALAENPVLGNELVSREQVLQIVPLFVAALVWLTRILLIGTIAGAGDRFLNQSASAQPRGAVPRAQPREATPVRTVGTGSGSRAPLPSQTLPSWSNRSVPAHATPERTPAYAPSQARAADERESPPRRYDPPAQPAVPAPSWPTSRATTDERDSGPRSYDTPARSAPSPASTAPSWQSSRASTVNTVRRDPPAFTPQTRPSGSSGYGSSQPRSAAPLNELTYEDME